MGIYKLMSLIQEKAPDAIKKRQIEQYQGRTVAVDASMAMYQFLVSTQGFNQNDYQLSELTDKDGNKTGHLVGLFYRSLTLLEHGIKPIWVFDGTPPEMKMEELQRRKQLKNEAKDKVEEKMEEGNIEEAQKQKQRTTYISKEMKEDAMQMLELMGMSVVQASSEAEAQCAELNKHKRVYGVVSDDMDTLTFQCQLLLRGFNNKKEPVNEIDYHEMLKGFEMSYLQFVDLCILCGCDYTPTIEGIGPVTAYKLIKQFNNLENVIKHLQQQNEDENKKKKYLIPQQFLDRFEAARQMFTNPNVIPADQVIFKKGNPVAQEDKLTEFLVNQKGFNLLRVEGALKKIKNFSNKGAQTHIDAFFGKPITIKSSNASIKQKPQINKKIKKM